MCPLPRCGAGGPGGHPSWLPGHGQLSHPPSLWDAVGHHFMCWAPQVPEHREALTQRMLLETPYCVNMNVGWDVNVV